MCVLVDSIFNNVCVLTNLIQQLDRKAFLCDSGHLHDITSGRPLDRGIECPTTAKTIVNDFLTREGHRLTWSCAPCRKTYRSGTLSCSSPACSKLKGTTKLEATSQLLTQIDRMVLEAVAPCEEEDPVVINPAMLATILLSPHGQSLEGLKIASWTTSGASKCDCDAVELGESGSEEEEENMEETQEVVTVGDLPTPDHVEQVVAGNEKSMKFRKIFLKCEQTCEITPCQESSSPYGLHHDDRSRSLNLGSKNLRSIHPQTSQ